MREMSSNVRNIYLNYYNGSKEVHMRQTQPIRIRLEIKEELKKMKTHPRETYDDVISRLIEEYKKSRK